MCQISPKASCSFHSSSSMLHNGRRKLLVSVLRKPGALVKTDVFFFSSANFKVLCSEGISFGCSLIFFYRQKWKAGNCPKDLSLSVLLIPNESPQCKDAAQRNFNAGSIHLSSGLCGRLCFSAWDAWTREWWYNSFMNTSIRLKYLSSFHLRWKFAIFVVIFMVVDTKQFGAQWQIFLYFQVISLKVRWIFFFPFYICHVLEVKSYQIQSFG